MQQLEPRLLFSASIATADAYAPNFLLNEAYVLDDASGSLGETAGLATATADDWYRVSVGAGPFTAELQANAAEGELNIELFNADGDLLTGNYGSEDNSTVSIDFVDAEQDVLIHIYAFRGDFQGNTYDIAWDGAALIEPVDPLVPTGADAYEDNDREDQATLFIGTGGSLSDRQGLATATDNDWYRFQASAGDFTARIEHTAVDGDLNIELYTVDGRKLDGAYASEDISEVSTQLTFNQDVLVFVYGKGDYQGNAYELVWSNTTSPFPVDSVGPTIEDNYEPNDSADEAPRLAASDSALSITDGKATATDNDWYRFSADAGTFTVTLDSVPAEGELNVEIYNASGIKLAGNYRSEISSSVSIDLDEAQDVLVFVYGRGYQGNAYDLIWTGGTTPVDPADPIDPGTPVDTVDPINPVTPVDTVDPTDPGTPVEPSGPEDLTSDLGIRYQTVEGFGANFAWFFDDPLDTQPRSPFQDPAISEGFYDGLGANIVRIDLLPFALSETQELAPTPFELDDPIRLSTDTQANIALFNFDAIGIGHVTDIVQQGEQLYGAEDFKLIGSIWTPPHWMKGPDVFGGSGPIFSNIRDTARGSLIDTPDNLEQFGLYVTAWVKGYEQAVGVEIDALSIQNELRFSQPFNSAVYDPALYDKALDAVRDAFDAHNAANPDDPINTLLQGPEDVGVGRIDDQGFIFNQLNFIDDPTRDNGIETIEDLDIISIHGYTGAGIELTGPRDSAVQWAAYDQQLNERLAAAGKPDLPSWQTEHSGEKATWLYTHPTDSFQGANNAGEQYGAFALAVGMHDALVSGNVETYVYWQATAIRPNDTDFGLAEGTNFDTPKAAAFRHFSKHVVPDAQRFEVTSDSDLVLSSGYQNPDGSLTYVIINLSSEADTVTLGVPAGSAGEVFSAYQSSETQTYETLSPIIAGANAKLSAALPPYSVTTLTTSNA